MHYRGSGPIFFDLISNQVQMTIASVAVVEPYVKAGKLRAIMVMARERAPAIAGRTDIRGTRLQGHREHHLLDRGARAAQDAGRRAGEAERRDGRGDR